MYGFRADLLVLDNQLVCSFLGNEYCFSLSQHSLIIWRFRAGLRLPRISPALFGMSAALPHYAHAQTFIWWNFMGAASDIPGRHHLSTNSLMLWLVQPFYQCFSNELWALGAGVFCWCIHWCWAPQHCLFSWSSFPQMARVYCKEKSPWWLVRTTVICERKDKYFECSLALCWFRSSCRFSSKIPEFTISVQLARFPVGVLKSL